MALRNLSANHYSFKVELGERSFKRKKISNFMCLLGVQWVDVSMKRICAFNIF
jgi:hypothetical protein